MYSQRMIGINDCPDGVIVRNSTSGERAAEWLREVARLLVKKSESYGDSLAHPVRVFCALSTEDGIRVRIDDKLARIRAGKTYPGDDNIVDLVGYLALLATVREA